MPDATARDVGEFGLIARVVERFGTSPSVVLGPGDDAAVVLAPDGRVVATTDVLVEDVHFRLAWSTAYDVGRKAAAANLEFEKAATLRDRIKQLRGRELGLVRAGQ